LTSIFFTTTIQKSYKDQTIYNKLQT